MLHQSPRCEKLRSGHWTPQKNTRLFNGKQLLDGFVGAYTCYDLPPSSAQRHTSIFNGISELVGKPNGKLRWGELALRWVLISLSNCFLSVIEETRVNRSGSRGVWNKSRRWSVLFGSNAFRVKCMYLNTFTVWILITLQSGPLILLNNIASSNAKYHLSATFVRIQINVANSSAKLKCQSCTTWMTHTCGRRRLPAGPQAIMKCSPHASRLQKTSHWKGRRWLWQKQARPDERRFPPTDQRHPREANWWICEYVCANVGVDGGLPPRRTDNCLSYRHQLWLFFFFF